MTANYRSCDLGVDARLSGDSPISEGGKTIARNISLARNGHPYARRAKPMIVTMVLQWYYTIWYNNGIWWD